MSHGPGCKEHRERCETLQRQVLTKSDFWWLTVVANISSRGSTEKVPGQSVPYSRGGEEWVSPVHPNETHPSRRQASFVRDKEQATSVLCGSITKKSVSSSMILRF